MFYQLKQEFHNQIIFFPAVGFLWLFGVNFLIRYYAQKSIFKNIKEIINKLSI